MDRSQGLFAATALVVVAVSVVSGPLVGAVDLTQNPEVAPGGTGTADVEVRDVPKTVVLEQADFGAGTYHLAGPSASVAVGTVTGNPLLEYVIHIPALDFTDIKTYDLRNTPRQTLELTFRPVELSPKRVRRETYNGTIEIRLQSDEFGVLYEGPVTVEVRE